MNHKTLIDILLRAMEVAFLKLNHAINYKWKKNHRLRTRRRRSTSGERGGASQGLECHFELLEAQSTNGYAIARRLGVALQGDRGIGW